MKTSLKTKLASLALGMAMALGGVVGLGVEKAKETKAAGDTTYVFNSKSWGLNSTSTEKTAWSSGKDGGQFTSNQGIQVATGQTGANGTSGKSFTNVSKVVVNYCTNTSKGKGTIKVAVGTTEKSYSVTAPSSSGTTRRDTDDFVFSPTASGKVKITVDCSTNSIYIWSVTITEAQAAAQFKVTYSSNGGTGTVAQTTHTQGVSSALSSNTFTRTGYTQDGWSTSATGDRTYTLGQSVTISENTTLYAHWVPNTFLVTYSANGGTGTVASTSQTYGVSTALSSNKFTKNGFIQDGWSTSATGAKIYDLGQFVQFTANTTLYAHWKANEYQITYDPCDGSGNVSPTVGDFGSDVTLASSGFTKENYTLDGWATQKNGNKVYDLGATITMPLNGTTLYAYYKINEYTVTYNGNGGTPNIPSMSVKYGYPVDLSVGASKGGFSLVGWNVTPDADSVLSSLNMQGSNLTLYAIWQEDKTAYHYNTHKNDGSSEDMISSTEFYSGDRVLIPNITETRTGYTALGWSSSRNGEVEYRPGDYVEVYSEDFNIYIVWQKHLDAAPTLSLSSGNEMWYGTEQILTIGYTVDAETLRVNSSSSSVQLEKQSDSNGTATYKVIAHSVGSATITAGDSHYSNSINVLVKEDKLDCLVVSGSLATSTFYVGNTIKASELASSLTVMGQTLSGKQESVSYYQISWSFAGGSTSLTLDNDEISSIQLVATANSSSGETYTGSKTFDIIVEEVVLTRIEVSGQKTSYTLGEQYNGDGITVHGYYNNGSDRDLVVDTEYSVDLTNFDSFTTGSNYSITYSASGVTPVVFNNIEVNAASYTTTGEDTHTYTYEKVTSALSDWRGKYLIIYETGNVAMDGSLETLDAVGNSVSVTISNGKIATDENGQISVGDTKKSVYFSVDYKGSSTSIYTLKSASGYYISGTTTKSKAGNGIKSDTSATDFEISFSGTELQSKSSDQQMAMKYNKANDQTRFRFYKSGQEAVALYKFTDTTTPGQTITSNEKHPIRITNVTCSKEKFVAGDSISKDDFTISVQYDTGNALTNNLHPTSIDVDTLVEDSNEITLTYDNGYGSIQTKFTVTAVAKPTLTSITLSGEYQTEFSRASTSFNYDGLIVTAHYSDGSTKTVSPTSVTGFNSISVTDSQTITVSYTEDSITRTAAYSISIVPLVTTEIILDNFLLSGAEEIEPDETVENYLRYTIIPENSYSLYFSIDGDEGAVSIDGGSDNTWVDGDGLIYNLESDAEVNEEVEFTVTCGDATLTLVINVVAGKEAIISDISTNGQGASAYKDGSDHTKGYFDGYFTDVCEFELSLTNFADPEVNVSDDTSTDAVSVSGNYDSNECVYNGTITLNSELKDYELILEITNSEDDEVYYIYFVINSTLDAIDSITVTPNKTTYNVGDSFNSSMTVTYTRLSGKSGTLVNTNEKQEYTITQLDDAASLIRGEKTITVTSTENTSAKDSFTITVNKPSQENLTLVTKTMVQNEPTYVEDTSSWTILTSKTQLNENCHIYIATSNGGTGITGYSKSDGTVSNNRSDFTEYVITDVNKTDGTYKLEDPKTGKWISSNASNAFSIAATQNNGATMIVNSNGYLSYKDSNKDNRYLCINGSNYRCYKSVGSYTPFYVYISGVTEIPGELTPSYNDENVMSDSLFDFIYAMNQFKTNKFFECSNNGSFKGWAESVGKMYNKLSENDKKLLKTIVCGNGTTDGSTGLYTEGTINSCDMVIDFLERYDWIIVSYGKSYDFLGRFGTDGVNVNVNTRGMHKASLFGENSILNEVVTPKGLYISLIVLGVGIAAIGGVGFRFRQKDD